MMKVCGAVTVNDYGDTMTNLIRSNDDPNFPWLGALIGSAIIGFWYWVLTSLSYSVYFPERMRWKHVAVPSSELT